MSGQPTDLPISLFQWVMTAVGTILSAAGWVIWRRQDGMADDIEKIREVASGHVLEDERAFAKKDDLREAFRYLKEELNEIKATQDRSLGAIMARLERMANDK